MGIDREPFTAEILIKKEAEWERQGCMIENLNNKII
jgi:hypothetical protein